MFLRGVVLSKMRAAFPVLALSLSCTSLCSCGLFSTKPALPKQATSASEANGIDDFTMAVQSADIIYFPIDEQSAANERAAWKMLEAFRRAGAWFSIAWQEIEVDQQLILDEMGQRGDQLEDALDALRWDHSKSTRESSRAILHATVGVPQLALGCPRAVQAKLRLGETLNETERAMVPRDYRPPADGLENFAEQLAAVRGLREREIAHLYEAHLFAEQFTAERIVAFMRAHEGSKLLVFSRKRDLVGDGVPYFVAQKLKVRQINFDFDHRSREERRRLLTWQRTGDSLFGWL